MTDLHRWKAGKSAQYEDSADARLYPGQARPALMRFTPSLLEEIKARLPVSEVVRKRVQLKKSGREFSGLSPFTQEKSPSFFVNDQKMAWFDFSSGQNGHIFYLVMRPEGLPIPSAGERSGGGAQQRPGGQAWPSRYWAARRRAGDPDGTR